jgi:hypothetical protein
MKTGKKLKITYNTSLYCAMVVLLSAALILGNTEALKAQNKTSTKVTKQNRDNVEKTKLSPYEKLFDKKKVKTSPGLITLHNVEGKLYLELPVVLINRSFLLSSVVDNVSDMNLSYVGQRTSKPSQVCFTKSDSLIQVRSVPVRRIVDSGDEGIYQAVIQSSLPSVIISTPIIAYNSDSSAVVFDATSFFVSSGSHIGTLNVSSFGGFMQKISTFSKELSSLKDVESYEDNVSVISNMTYTFKTYFMGAETNELEYLTVELRTNLRLLPEDDFRYRFADYRIGTGVTEFERFSSKEQGVQSSYLATRWRVEPEDIDSYRKGELTRPKKPIVVYVDTLFIPSWREAVKKGLLKWNKVFENIGFKDVIQVYDYPSKSVDPKFSASNISYNCVKYVQIPSRNISRQINIDPRSGEILSASILFFKDSPVTLQRERLYQTAAVEPDVRGYELPDHLMCSSIEMAITREMGFCLGLSANLAASSWMPTDSLRSPSFTSREGIASSVMDQIKYNYIAQPGDIEKGVKLTIDGPGVYDYYAIEWLYKPFLSVKSEADEKFMLDGIIKDKLGDPRYFYGKEQSWSAYFDPRSIVEDLGNDKILAAKYGINTLKYVCENGTKWVNKDEADESYRELFVDFVFLKLYDYYRSLMVNIGGIEINGKYEGDPMPAYIPLSREIQKKSLVYMLEQADDLDWMNNQDLLIMSGMNSSFSNYIVKDLVSLVFQRIPVVAFTQNKTTHGSDLSASNSETSTNPYTVDEMLDDILNFALKNMLKGKEPTETQKSTLLTATQLLLHNSGLPKVNEAREKNKKAFQLVDDENYYSYRNIVARCFPDAILTDMKGAPEDFISPVKGTIIDELSDKSGFEKLSGIKYLSGQDLSTTYFSHLQDLRRKLEKCLSKAPAENAKSLIGYLINSIDKGI